MRVLYELGRLLLAGAARAGARRLSAIGDRLSGDVPDGAGLGIEVTELESKLAAEEAEGMIARATLVPEPEGPPTLRGSLEDRGRTVGQQWTR